MNAAFEPSKNKKSKWRFIWVLPILILIVTAVPKIIGMQFMIDNMAEAGMGHMTLLVGIIELSCVVVFLIPKFRNVGFLLLVAYSGGIIATQWASGMSVVPGLVVQVLLWVGMFFENRSLFQSN